MLILLVGCTSTVTDVNNGVIDNNVISDDVSNNKDSTNDDIDNNLIIDTNINNKQDEAIEDNIKEDIIAIDDSQNIKSEESDFCGTSTNAKCKSNEGCKIGGCSSQVCQGINEDIMTTCSYKDCYDSIGLSCICIDNQCQWN